MADLLSGFIELLASLFWVYFFILLGILWRFSPFYKKKYADWFTKFTIWIFFPISIISSFAKVETFAGIIIIQITVIAVVVHIGGYLIIRFLTKGESSSADAGALAFTATYPNALLFPFPIILAILGEDALVYAAIFVFLAMIIRNTFGIFMGSWYTPTAQGSEEEAPIVKFKLTTLIKSMFKFPPFLAVIAGFILHSLVGPEAIGNIPGLDIVKPIALYGSLLLVGVSFRDLSDLHPQNLFSINTYRVTVTRFLVAPILALIPIFLFRLEFLVAIPLLIQSMAPPAVSNIIYGTFFDLNESLMSSIITIVTLIALIVLPFELFILLILFPIP
ncbi:MAG: AEC family transporter [Candidatus Hodarchaeales archaeon]|jgi:predicted permease